MNIIICLNCSQDIKQSVAAKISDVLAELGLSVSQVEATNLSIINCTHQEVQTTEPVDASMCDKCGCEQCACDVAPSMGDMVPTDNIRAQEIPPEEPTLTVELPPVEVEKEPAIPTPSIGSCKILNLSTTLGVSVQINAQQDNTTLHATNVSAADGIVRFTFNNFQHALPLHVDDGRDTTLVNSSSHGYSQNTVRLVIDFDGKTYPSLVDIQEGQEHALIVGQDLLQIIGGQDVPRE